MKKKLVLLACCVIVLSSVSPSQVPATSIQAQLMGKWTQHYKGMSLQGATLNITYGSIATWTGFLKENKIIASSSNVRPNSGYEWDHITATYDVWTRTP